ncbi:hypothetical protein [Pseudoalteromonas luteoviolacea]|uniref:Uncharacterized protein n=1 Tax=Pseudoalteromonas luteoviolacea DSM 6061 TaxID=1365250 RepID=A0A166VHG3_9GAMM|nr:hypothetical protein [Pseudoalteromonas luteoviolacea]KZN32793.1 hypothetical protein N475_21075 [Pseudoalteromonas luteoviolacea DSM 6061]KZN53910.1 hypothetical protein N474_18890 [Pseudoalteromonas luteoviolacea CPMOR-2]MBE0385869.1 hypothetical protein [Pseudoalteromonas luteoviolacea DSM 6061]TQF70789.1 hypothetical protein FLM44_06785 [Pseudoalteromonas luteoviolacea]
MLKVELMTGFAHLRDEATVDALSLHSQAVALANQKEGGYLEALADSLPASDSLYISSVDTLFKRYEAGFGPIKDFLLGLKFISNHRGGNIKVRVNIFVFAFLAHAKNLDLMFCTEVSANHKGRFLSWQNTIDGLVLFELKGRTITNDRIGLAEPYLKLRKILERDSTRNELALLALLTFSSPMQEEEILKVLGGSHSGLKALLFTLLDTGVVTKSFGLVTINEKYIPIAVFFVRAKLGVDLMALAKRWV